MWYEALYDMTAELTYGSLTLRFLRCMLDSCQESSRYDCPSETWSAQMRTSVLKLSSQYFSQHGCEDSNPATYWIDLGNCGLAVKIKASGMKLSPCCTMRYRIMLRRCVNKLLRIRDSSPQSPALSRRLKLQLSQNESHPLELEEVSSLVYVPLTSCACFTIRSSFYLSLDLPPSVRSRVSPRLSEYPFIVTPLAPFEALKVRLPVKGIPFIASFSGEDSVATYMLLDEIKRYTVMRGDEKAVKVFPSLALKPIIDEFHNLTLWTFCHPPETSVDSASGAPTLKSDDPKLSPSFACGSPILAPSSSPDTGASPLTSAVESQAAHATQQPNVECGERTSLALPDEEQRECDGYPTTGHETITIPSPATDLSTVADPTSTEDSGQGICESQNFRPDAVDSPSSTKKSKKLDFQSLINKDEQDIDKYPAGSSQTVNGKTGIMAAQPSVLRHPATPRDNIDGCDNLIPPTPADENESVSDDYQTVDHTNAADPPTPIQTNLLPIEEYKTLVLPPTTVFDRRGFDECHSIDLATVVPSSLALVFTTTLALPYSFGCAPVNALPLTIERRTIAPSSPIGVDTRRFHEWRPVDLLNAVTLPYTFNPAATSQHSVESAAVSPTTLDPLPPTDVDRAGSHECRNVELGTSAASLHSSESGTFRSLPQNIEQRTRPPT